ncbi:MAG: hypothetical protein E7164_01965 [Firmicutes bacterium]|nr:hypothetical protein [Bacillota bacterium]
MNFDHLTQKINEALKELDIFVDNIEYIKKGKYNFLEITLDKVGGIDLDGIVEATRIVNPIVDEENFTEDSYILDVSSKERG